MNVALAMQGMLDKCLLLALSVPREDLPDGILPEGFRLQTHGGRAFWNVVICHVDKMRPLGVPRLMGMSYHHVGYRLYVEADTADRGLLQGLYFTHSQADSRIVCAGGNVASDFMFHFDRIEMAERNFNIKANCGGLNGSAENSFRLAATMQTGPPRALGTTFASQEEALKFLKYRPLGLALGKNRLLRIARVMRNEADWCEHNLDVKELGFDFFAMRELKPKLELATWVGPIDYRWQLGETARLV